MCPRLTRHRRNALAVTGWALLTIAGFTVYLRLAQTRAVNSDGAGNALQAWAMLHGNPLLRGWRLSDVSFYTTELPQYMLIELVRGLHADVVDIGAAMTYTLTMLTAALLAKGTVTGREGVLRACLAAAIMLAPQLGDGTNTLLSSPDHIGTAIPIMLAWLILDRGGRRWYVPVAVSLILGWTAVGDQIALLAAVPAVALVCLYRLLRARRLLRFEASLGVGVVACGAAAIGVLKLIHAAGGFYVATPHAHFVSLGKILGHNLKVTGESLMVLFGASFLHLHGGADYAFAALHLTGVALAVWAIVVTARRWHHVDLADQIIVAAIAINLAGYAFTLAPISIGTAREMNPVLPLAAVLAGRRLAPLLTHSAKRVCYSSARTLIFAGYLAGLVHETTQPASPPQQAALASWLESHHLTSGLSGYWASNVVTLTTGDRVRIAVGGTHHGLFSAGNLETNMTWYNHTRYSANFVVFYPGSGGYGGFTLPPAALARFGEPAHIYRTGEYTVLVWNKNILPDLAFVPLG